MKQAFERVYERGEWGVGSGPGSSLEACLPLIDVLAAFFAENNVKTLCDIGCGDQQWAPALRDRTGVQYIGVDCVGSVMSNNRAKWPECRWIEADVSEMDASLFPEADVYLMKDVLQHWPTDTVDRWLTEWFLARPNSVLLVANCANQPSSSRTLSAGGFVPLSGAHLPLANFGPVEMLSWGTKKLYRLAAPQKVTRAAQSVVGALVVYQPSAPKVRLGSPADGGYVIVDGGTYDRFLSGGVGGDTSFEAALLTKYPDLECLAFDHTVSQLPPIGRHPRIRHVRKSIGAADDASCSSLRQELESSSSAFVKMDVEGGEYAWLDALSDRALGAIAQLVIEFHHCDEGERWRVLHRLARTHWLVHVHGNNYGRTVPVDGVQVPIAIECTYVRKSNEQLLRSRSGVPSPLDRPNAGGRPDIHLSGFPYSR